MFLNSDIETVVAELDAQRAAMGMSYQDVADACGVSKATVYRALVGKTQPTMQLLHCIAAAVQYREKRPDILPEELTQEAYISFLKELVSQKDEDIDLRAKQLHAHYNKLLRRERRSKTVWVVFTLLLLTIFVVLFLYDFANLDRGWIQALQSGYKSTAYTALLAVRSWFCSLWA